MDFRFVGFMLFFLKQVSTLPLGCSYNGTVFKEGEAIVTEEPCLSCVCRKGSLVCNLRICPNLPEELPLGCFVVYKPNHCCPQVLCEEGFIQNDVELRTSFRTDNKMLQNGCYINGSVYAEGSALASSQLCEYCYCIQGQMKCIKPKCYQPFEGCKPIYKDSSCCPTHYDCRELVMSVSTANIDYGCKRDGIYYRDGDMVPSQNGSICESCYCMKSKIECAPIICSMDFFEDCQPILAPDQCCPTSFACGKSKSKETNNSIRSFTTQNLEDKENVDEKNISTEAPENSTKVEEKTTESEEFRTTTETTTTTEYSTISTEIETTTSVILWKAEINVGDNSTFLSLQASSQNNSTESTSSATEETTFSPEVTSAPMPEAADLKKEIYDIEIETKLDFADQRAASGLHLDYDDNRRNSSSNSDDYDSYDYSEPKLPPSLPNLVIYPFVAADAVVKEESTPEPEVFNSDSIKRIDTQSVFYKDFFSPPAQTEGGFVPKESSEPFYENSYFNAEEKWSEGGGVVPHITMPPKPHRDDCYSKGRIFQNGEIISESGECVVCSCLQGSIVCEDIVCPPAPPGCKRSPDMGLSCCGTIICEPNPPEIIKSQVTKVDSFETSVQKVTPQPLNEILKTGTDSEVSFISESAPFRLTHQTAKPVTVTYKNIVVDYYPDFQITSSRTTIKNNNENSFLKPEKTYSSVATSTKSSQSQENQKKFFSTTESLIATETTNVKLPVAVIKPIPTKKPTTITTTSESSFFDEFFKSFLSEEKETKPTQRPSKYKYSSKIKATTAKINEEEVTEKLVDDYSNSSTSSYSFLDFLFNPDLSTTLPTTTTKNKIINKTNKYDNLMKKPLKKEETKKPVKSTLESGVTEPFPHKETHDLENEEKENLKKKPTNGVEETQKKHSSFSLLKLAGCNIYGRMYRVGKIIFELSGPCIECVCTDLGVQCKPLNC